jgi:pimeloyl-ACP methyl ester carboxylesterase
MIKSAIYFHGLESSQGGIKVQFLDQEVDFLEAPAMDYTKEGIFEEWLDYVKNEEPDLLIGSSMGGYFAMALATHTGIPVLIFNPAIHSRSIEINGLESGTEKLKGLVVLGKKDDVINPGPTMAMLQGNWNDLDMVVEEKMGHRVPLDVFIDMYNKIAYDKTIKND